MAYHLQLTTKCLTSMWPLQLNSTGVVPATKSNTNSSAPSSSCVVAILVMAYQINQEQLKHKCHFIQHFDVKYSQGHCMCHLQGHCAILGKDAAFPSGVDPGACITAATAHECSLGHNAKVCKQGPSSHAVKDHRTQAQSRPLHFVAC